MKYLLALILIIGFCSVSFGQNGYKHTCTGIVKSKQLFLNNAAVYRNRYNANNTNGENNNINANNYNTYGNNTYSNIITVSTFSLAVITDENKLMYFETSEPGIKFIGLDTMIEKGDTVEVFYRNYEDWGLKAVNGHEVEVNTDL